MTEMTENTIVAVIGLGYVGLPLAVEFGKKYVTIGFDLSDAKIAAYRKGFDPMLEGVRFVARNDVAALRAAMDDNVCGIVLEPIQG